MSKNSNIIKETMAILVAAGGMAGIVESNGNPVQMANIQESTLNDAAEVMNVGETSEMVEKVSSFNSQIKIKN